ncbi:hypothetical protein C2G38_2154410 [Gigaspora rosea]|uniref:Protein kinase domain-containing protein n=1 Tax=Gigaspora rosea TaxID=44941 RepID=A0A397W879_9GLOM|nr:hypothetical protein C2G38_2154410 [Gigaspora rosea]
MSFFKRFKRFKTSQNRKINGHTVFNPRNSIGVIPNGQGGYIARGVISTNLCLYEESLEDFKIALSIEPNNLYALTNRGVTYLELEKYEESLRDLNKALEIDPNFALALSHRGIVCMKTGDYNKSLLDLNNALEINPKDIRTLEQRGNVHRILRHDKEFLEDLNSVLKISPNDVNALVFRGIAYGNLGRHEESLIDLNKALEIDENVFALCNRGIDENVFAVCNRGITYKNLGQYEEALVDLNKSINIDPTSVTALNQRGNTYRLCRGDTYRLLGQYNESPKDLNKSLEIEPNNESALISRSETYKQLETDPNNVSALEVHKKARNKYINQYLKKNFNNWTSNNEFIDQVIRNCQIVTLNPDTIVEWIPFENFKDVNFKTKGGFGSIYIAVWSDGWILVWDEKSSKLIRTGAITVVLKSLDDFIKLNDENLEEVISNIISNLGSYGVKCYGLTKNPDSSKYLLVLKYMENGDLESCLLDKNKEFNWKEIYSLLQQIFKQLHALHNSNMVHRDLHPGNILSDQEKWFISDFGFCGPVDKILNNIYGVLDMLPLKFHKQCYTTKSDIYSMGVIMWQLVTRKNPYPEFTDAFGILDPSNIIIFDPPNIIGLPTTYERMMKKCLDPNSEQRPDAQELFSFFDKMLGQISNDNDKNSEYVQNESDNLFELELLQHDLNENLQENLETIKDNNVQNKSDKLFELGLLNSKFQVLNIKALDSSSKSSKFTNEIDEFDSYLTNKDASYNLNQYREYLINFGNSPRINERSEAYRMLGQYEESLVDLNAALNIEPNNELALKYRAEIYRRFRRFEESLFDINKVLKIDKYNAMALVIRGIVYFSLGRHEESLTDLDRSLEIKPDNPFALTCRGETYFHLCNYEEALANYNGALKIKPNYAVALFGRGIINCLSSQYKNQWKILIKRWK